MKRMTAAVLTALLGLCLFGETISSVSSGGSWEWNGSSSFTSGSTSTTTLTSIAGEGTSSSGGATTQDSTEADSASTSGTTGTGQVDGMQGSEPFPYPRAVVFTSEADNLVPGDTNKCADVFHFDMLTGKMTRVSVNSVGTQGDFASGFASVSADGLRVAFSSHARNLVLDDFNDAEDVFVHDLRSSETIRVSVSGGGKEGDGGSELPCLSPDGQFVSFRSTARNLIAGKVIPQAIGQIYVRDCLAQNTFLITAGPNGLGGDNSAMASSISNGGRWLAFTSAATDLDPNAAGPQGVFQIYLHDRLKGTTILLSRDKMNKPVERHAHAPSISADGQVVAFAYRDPDLGFLFNVRIVDLARNLRMDIPGAVGPKPDRDSDWPSLSWDGRYVGFSSEATNLLGQGADNNWTWDTFRYDRFTGILERMSVDSKGAEPRGGGGSWKGRISLDGRFMAFDSLASGLAGANPNDKFQVYVRYAEFGATRRISEAAGFPGNGPSTEASMN